MTNIKTSELTGAALDWAVARCEGRTDVRVDPDDGELVGQSEFDYSTDWAQAGPILQRERITIRYWQNTDTVHAYTPGADAWQAATDPLTAAMRAFVSLKLGSTVEVPDELINT